MLGHDPRSWVSSVEAAALQANRTAQLLCVLQALCSAAALEDVLPRERCVAGYSVGEMAAWSVAGLFAPRDALALTVARAEAMDAARRGVQGMLFIRGLSRASSSTAYWWGKQDAAVAIVNPGNAPCVVAGTQAALQPVAAGRPAPRRGTRRSRWRERCFAHTVDARGECSVWRAARPRARGRHPTRGTRLFSGIDGSVVLNGPAAVGELASQLSQPVQWAACLEACVEAGADTFLELGPGSALAKRGERPSGRRRPCSVDEFKLPLEGVARTAGAPPLIAQVRLYSTL